MSPKCEAEALFDAGPHGPPQSPTRPLLLVLLAAAVGACLGAVIVAALAAPQVVSLRAQQDRLQADVLRLQHLYLQFQMQETSTPAALIGTSSSTESFNPYDAMDENSDESYDYGEDESTDDDDDEDNTLDDGDDDESSRRRRRDVEMAPPVRVARSQGPPTIDRTSDGVPVVSLSYEQVKQMNRSGHHLRLYDQLATSPPLPPTADPIQLHHRISPLWESPKNYEQDKKKKKAPSSSGSSSGVTASTIMNRRSRTMDTPEEGGAVSLGASMAPGVVLRVLQDRGGQHNPPQAAGIAPPTIVRRPAGGLVRSAGAEQHDKRPRRKHQPRSDAGGNHHPFRVAAHFTADSSMYTLAHPNYKGNGRLRHAGVFTDWKSADFMDELALERYFSLKDGILTVKLGGLYYFYSQIYYIEDHDTNGYNVFVNSEVRLQCVTTTHSSTNVVKVNTCYTGGVLYLRPGDTIFLRDIAGLRYSLFEREKSFFGLYRFANAQPRLSSSS
ncbi:uncharacterized protein egr [Cloeon dipterum]|uniref:uncharacterized protein egr n=1 Tax=Cloeon dipterum TaxID=197152 RepID=UPI003220612F